MKIVLSPAKSLDFENIPEAKVASQPIFLDESQLLINKLKKYSPKKLGDLMSISPKLSDLNYSRFQDWTLPFTKENAKTAMYVFTGDAYRGMNPREFSQEDVVNSTNYLRILSGLYGLIKPLDIIQPYRLEMGTKLDYTKKVSNLYKFWGDKVTDALNSEMEKEEVLINLASNEYFKVIDPKKLNHRIVTCSFKDEKNGEYKMISFFAKFARGLMTRFIIQNKITEVEHLKAFDLERYCYNEEMSTEDNFVFVR
jgi:cytoplasmic iron level regulating protein YaaA (DUF328/UPF0246 family)